MRLLGTKTGVDHISLAATPDRPNEIVERHRAVMHIAPEKIFAGVPVVAGVTHGGKFIRFPLSLPYRCRPRDATSTPAQSSMHRTISVKSDCGPRALSVNFHSVRTALPTH